MANDHNDDDDTSIEGVAGGLTGDSSSDDEETIVGRSDGLELGTESIFLELDQSGRIGSGVELRELESDGSVPDAKKGRARYQVLKTLGEGGMGKVHLVADRDLKRRVAMKVMRHEAKAHKARFLEEIQIHAQLDHPNIVPV